MTETFPTSRRCPDYGIAGHSVGGDPAPGILSWHESQPTGDFSSHAPSHLSRSFSGVPASFLFLQCDEVALLQSLTLKGSRGRWRNLQCLSGFPCKGASPKKPQFSVEFDLAWRCQQLGLEADAGMMLRLCILSSQEKVHLVVGFQAIEVVSVFPLPRPPSKPDLVNLWGKDRKVGFEIAVKQVRHHNPIRYNMNHHVSNAREQFHLQGK